MASAISSRSTTSINGGSTASANGATRWCRTGAADRSRAGRSTACSRRSRRRSICWRRSPRCFAAECIGPGARWSAWPTSRPIRWRSTPTPTCSMARSPTTTPISSPARHNTWCVGTIRPISASRDRRWSRTRPASRNSASSATRSSPSAARRKDRRSASANGRSIPTSMRARRSTSCRGLKRHGRGLATSSRSPMSMSAASAGAAGSSRRRQRRSRSMPP